MPIGTLVVPLIYHTVGVRLLSNQPPLPASWAQQTNSDNLINQANDIQQNKTKNYVQRCLVVIFDFRKAHHLAQTKSMCVSYSMFVWLIITFHFVEYHFWFSSV